jgi:hypothetical protein
MVLLSIALAVAIGCVEPTPPVETWTGSVSTEVITADSCTPATGTYRSCSDALATTAATSGCFSIRPPTSTTAVARSCALHRILVMQVANEGYFTPTADQAYLDAVVDSLTAFVDTASYGRAVLAIDVAGQASLPTGERWYATNDSKPDKANYTQLLQPSDTPRPLGDYDFISTFATSPGHSVEVGCQIASEARSCNIVYRYRSDSSDTFAMNLHHETGHSLGFAHDRAFSSLTGYGPARTTFQGQWEQYGGRSSVMGTATDAGYNLPERVSAGWLNDGIAGAGRHVVSVDSGSQTVALDELEQDVEGIKGVYVPVTGGNYWIETRRDPALSAILQTGVLIHFSSDAGSHSGGMVDGTPETASDPLVDGALPVGRTYADVANGVYITALSQTATTTTVQVERDPVDASPPMISSIDAIDCVAQPLRCPGAPKPLPGLRVWRFEATATDADGDPLSYSWRVGIGTNEVATPGSYRAGSAFYYFQPLGTPAIRAFLTVSDRKGGTAAGYASEMNYPTTWVAPQIPGLAVLPVEDGDATADNQLIVQTSADPTGTELLNYSWTIDGATSTWPRTLIAPAPDKGPGWGASVPSCLDTELHLSDPTNCTAHPSTCTAIASGCVAPALRLSYVMKLAMPNTFLLTLSASTAVFPAATFAWSANCSMTVDPSQLSATMPSPGCKATVTVTAGRKTYTATVTPQ